MRRSRVRQAAWRALLHWLVTFDRLYVGALCFSVMFTDSNRHMQDVYAHRYDLQHHVCPHYLLFDYYIDTRSVFRSLIVITVTTLSFGQFIIELLEIPPSPTHNHSDEYKEPLLPSHSQPLSRYRDRDSADDPHGFADSYPPPIPLTLHAHRPVTMRAYHEPPPITRSTRSGSLRSKPEGLNIYIHPSENNVVRADVVARELGLTSEDDEDEATGIYHGDANETEPLWEPGKGRDVARSMLKR